MYVITEYAHALAFSILHRHHVFARSLAETIIHHHTDRCAMEKSYHGDVKICVILWASCIISALADSVSLFLQVIDQIAQSCM